MKEEVLELLKAAIKLEIQNEVKFEQDEILVHLADNSTAKIQIV